MPGLLRSLARSWSSTLKLPKSAFPPRIAAADQATYLKRCTDDLYQWQRRNRPPNATFTLHDGPPYANGELHVGHALNKITKDIICRVQLAKGKRIDYIPGWDCHGLPIEMKALQGRSDLEKAKTSSSGEAAASIRIAARQLATNTVLEQMEGFRSWGVMADWGNRWTTMDPLYERNQLQIFLEMVQNGLIHRALRPVYWSPSSGTALAEAELEYKDDHVSTAALVKFQLHGLPSHISSHPSLNNEDISAVIWTTTPWTLPANVAIAIRSSLEYAVVNSSSGKLIVAHSRLQYVQQLLGEDLEVIISNIPGSDLLGASYLPLFSRVPSSSCHVISADFVTDEAGTGLVHCAPGHGMEDYEVCLKLGLPILSPVNNQGRFDRTADLSRPDLLHGKSVLKEGNREVLNDLKSRGQLLHKHSYKHRYPYDWRSKQPVIIRATSQWFADVGGIRNHAIQALQSVRFIPETGKSRLEAFVKKRSEWCISRQRAWGVPIPALYCSKTGKESLTPEIVLHIMNVIEERGIDAWWTDAKDDQAWVPQSLHGNGTNYIRGTDTMDVWFDSGTSWTQMSKDTKPQNIGADVYYEGTDQHRGWFQSSLLTYIAHQIAQDNTSSFEAPFKTLITHGFTLDKDGRKMSKSLGNIIRPHEIMNGTLLPPLKPKKIKGVKASVPAAPVFDSLGPDALRLWVAGSDYTKDIVIGQQVLKAVNINLHKLRVTIKLILGALESFDPTIQVPYKSLHATDKIALSQLRALVIASTDAFDKMEFFKMVTAINKWANLEFSAFYIEAIKDRLYADEENGVSRRAAQTTLFHIYTHIQTLLGPIVPLLVEESWEHAPEKIKQSLEHPLRRTIPMPNEEWRNDSLEEALPILDAANSAIKSIQESARLKKQMGSSLQSFVHLELPKDTILPDQFLSELADIFVVSRVTLGSEISVVSDEVLKAEWHYRSDFQLPNGRTGKVWVYSPNQAKCPRCWRYAAPPKAQSNGDEGLCQRCDDVVSSLPEIGHQSPAVVAT
ncbi:isoleucine-tRNA ligase [Myotisia sp. PD_48]|nr:isoleucine-tRNA ligase [Myotisia sp. PD_48]